MDWQTYKRICDRPDVFSRWMIEQSLALMADPALARQLARCLEGAPLTKPADHRGGIATDMFAVDLTHQEARCIHLAVVAATAAGATTPATRARGLGGFVEAWGEYVRFLETSRDEARRVIMNRAAATVRSLIDAFNANDLERVLTHFTPNAVYHNIPMAAVTGTDAIRGVLQSFLALASKVDWQVRHLVADDAGVVLTERVDRFLINGKWLELPVMGAFEVVGDRIAAWRDYFDLNQFQSQLGG